MAYFINGYPYSDTHNLNLDWVIDTLKRVETEIGQIRDGLEIHVTDTNGVEIYTFTVKANGIYITRTDSGTPFFYNYDSQTLHAPYFDGQSFLVSNGRATGQFKAGSLVLDTALPIAQGGTGATTAAAARTALGAEAAFNMLPISKGGNGNAIAAGTVLGLSYRIVCGHITSGRKNLCFDIPIFCDLTGSGRTPASLSGSVIVRCQGGYIGDSAGMPLSNFTQDLTIGGSVVRVALQSATELSPTYNNYPISVQFTEGSTLTFA